MALRDPVMREFVNLTKTDELATEFSREHDLLLTDLQLQARGKLIFAFI